MDRADLPEAQRALRARCRHPSGARPDFPATTLAGSIADRFRAVAAQYSERTAIVGPSGRLSYAELARAAERIAQAVLAARGPDAEPVALLAADDAPLFAAALGALAAGKSVVPLDPDQPPARLRALLEDARPGAILADQASWPRARDVYAAVGGEGALLRADVDGAATDAVPSAALPAIAPDRPSFVLYTSGSTGEPKGVAHTQRSSLFDMAANTGEMAIVAEDRCAKLSRGLGLSRAQRETWVALLNGAVLLLYDVRRDGLGGLAGWLARERVTILQIVPSLFRSLAGGLGAAGSLPDLRLVRLGGEQAAAIDLELYRAHLGPHTLLMNGLGASETGTMCTYFLDRDSQPADGQLPVGHPVPGLAIDLLDGDGRAVARGEPGEIAVRGAYLDAEYWRRPELTRAAFRRAPTGERSYLTGDLGVVAPDGALLHLGRKDQQVQVRGHRVEVGEVEGALLAQPGVEAAAVVAREGPRGETRLVAYVVGARGPAPAALRRALADALPGHMVPALFVPLPALPRLSSGKIDRRALPAPDFRRPPRTEPLVAPRTPLERHVARLWEEALGVDQVGAHDDFFELGGDSLVAGQIVSRLSDELRLRTPPVRLLECGTVAAMALAALADLAADAPPGELPPGPASR